MTFDAAVIREQGQTFAVVAVKGSAASSDSARRETMSACGSVFPGVPIVLMVQDGRGRPTYYGRQDIVNFLARVDMARMPWKRYS